MSNVETGTIACACYEDGNLFLGVAKVTLPDIERETFNIKGLALMGSFDLPATGQVKPMKMTIEFTDANEAQYKLDEERSHLLDLRVLKAGYDNTSAELTRTNHRYLIQCYPIKSSGGTVSPVESQGVSSEHSVTMIKEFRDNKLYRHIDVIKMIYVDSSGVDRFAEIRKHLGME
ncbi:MAG: phage major tail tube protein [Oscillospiraceae bacterium]|nr:phage major tail tube protein [Oscillospiraceae bacterium]